MAAVTAGTGPAGPTAPAGTATPAGPTAQTGISLRSRLVILTAVGTILLMLVAVLSGLAISNLVSARHTLLGEVDPASLEADQLLLAYVNQETGVRGYVLSADPAFLQPYTQGLGQERTATAQLDDHLDQLPALLALAHRAEGQAVDWHQKFAAPAIASVAAGGHAYSSVTALLASKSLFDLIRDRFATLDAALAAKRSSAGATLNSATDLLIGILVGAFVLLVAVGVGMRTALRRWVTNPLLHLGADARQVAAGDIVHPIAAAGAPEFQRLSEDVESMRTRIVAELAEVETARTDLADRNRDLARSNIELEQFAYVASHDLQEPLRKVTSFVQLLQQRYEGQLDERADQFIGFAVDGAKRMQVLINDLLAFSRVGRTTERFVPVALTTTLDSALANLASAIEESDARVHAPSLPTVLGDPGLLTALWQNLIGNSLKFRADRPPTVTIEVTAGEGTAGSGSGPGSEWTFSVTDNGVGIEPRFADKVFVIFQRLHSREAYEGTGIGLALCKKIVEFHGGRIWLDADHDHGARLCFTLPAMGNGGSR